MSSEERLQMCTFQSQTTVFFGPVFEGDVSARARALTVNAAAGQESAPATTGTLPHAKKRPKPKIIINWCSDQLLVTEDEPTDWAPCTSDPQVLYNCKARLCTSQKVHPSTNGSHCQSIEGRASLEKRFAVNGALNYG